MSDSSVGQRLQEARQARRITPAEVSQATKIQPWVLEAIESNRLQATMSPIYVKSFLITYAKFLQLDPYPLIAQMFPPAPLAPAPEIQPVAAVSVASWPLDGLRDALGALLRRLVPVAVVAATVAFVAIAKPLRWLPSLRVTQASFSAPLKPAPVSPSAALTVKPTQPLDVAVVARRPSWISVKADGDLVAQQQLSPGSKEAWTARRRLELVIGNPAQVEVLLNGHSISPIAMAHHGRILITHKGGTPLDDEPQ